MNRIFISYRREDSESQAGRLADLLRERFGESLIFMDIDTIEPGQDFVEAIQNAVASCDVLIAVIGPDWLTITDKAGRRRIDSPEDFVRLEVATALDRNIRVIPLLVRRASMPSPQELPPALAPLARRNALEAGDAHFRRDADRLVKVLERLPNMESARRPPDIRPLAVPRWRWRALGAATAGAALVAAGWLTVMFPKLMFPKRATPPVQAPTAETPSVSPVLGLDHFAGTWQNIDAATRGLTRLEITVSGENVRVRAFGKCHPTDCDWGTVPATAFAPDIATSVTKDTRALTAVFKTSFNETTLTIRPAANEMISSDSVTRFTDASRRAPYSAMDSFRRTVVR